MKNWRIHGIKICPSNYTNYIKNPEIEDCLYDNNVSEHEINKYNNASGDYAEYLR